jgi:hypothetical protein
MQETLGATVAQYLEIRKSIQPVFGEFEHERLARPARKRKIGGEWNFTLGMDVHLIVPLMYFRLMKAGLVNFGAINSLNRA